MDTIVQADKRVLYQIAETLCAIGEGKIPSFVEADALAATAKELSRTQISPLRNLLVRTQSVLEARAKVRELEAEIEEKTAQLKALQGELLARQQLKYLSFDIHELISR